ncbi:Phosphotransferase enzyme family [Aspergillus sclerotialis]|uniref:Phosphotransferase enzyme family n=1 Tax=Aspergillus sclerotialis TaxID=2070753 RepID=A0A3A2ZQ33_9EURO|nr:Phosphotransferase enzyme family [Aspergillus sclerotialis]
MQDGRGVVAKLPNLNAGPELFATAGEVVTLKYVAGIAVPEVYAWDANLNGNPVDVEYIIIENASGVMLGNMRPTMTLFQKQDSVANVIEMEKSLVARSFEGTGNPYLESDRIDSSVRYIDIQNKGFVIGPSTSADFVRRGSRQFQPNIGPWTGTVDWIFAKVRSKENRIRELEYLPVSDGVFGGPRLYNPTTEPRLKVLLGFRKVTLLITVDDVAQNAADLREWKRSEEVFRELLKELGKNVSWVDWITHAEYEQFKQKY